MVTPRSWLLWTPRSIYHDHFKVAGGQQCSVEISRPWLLQVHIPWPFQSGRWPVFSGHSQGLIIPSPYTMTILKWLVASVQWTPLDLDYFKSIYHDHFNPLIGWGSKFRTTNMSNFKNCQCQKLREVLLLDFSIYEIIVSFFLKLFEHSNFIFFSILTL